MNLREKILRTSFLSGACHIGSALSCADIVEVVYDVKKKNDIFIFAKATGVSALYCYLHPLDKAWRYLKKYPLPNKEVPGVLWSGGSCGTGLSVAVGIALAVKLQHKRTKVYCLISDGELNEGQVWEAVMFAKQHGLGNLTVIVDNNGFQSLGATKNIIDMTTLIKKFHSFGWVATEVDGHNKGELKDAIECYHIANLPKVIIANTIKGKGVSFMENMNAWHYRNLDEKRLKDAVLQVSGKRSEKE